MTKEEIEHEKLWTEGIVSAVMLSSKGIVRDFISNLEKVGYKIVKAESENERLKAENGILKAKIIKIRCELLASTNLCNSFEVDRIFSENKAHWNNDLGEPLKVTTPKQSCPQCKTEYTKEELLTNEHCFKCGFEMKGF